MIKEIKDLPKRDTSVIYKANLEQVETLFKKDPEKAGELAISILELALKGDISSDDFYIDLMLQDMKYLVAKNQEKYDNRIETRRQKTIEEMKLIEIADMFKNGASQQTIADTLGIPQQTVSYRLRKIKEEFSELL